MAYNFRKKNKVGKIFTGILVGVLAVGAVFGIAKLFAPESDTKTISPWAFSIGGLSDFGGTYVDTNESIITKEAFECKGLKVDLKFDANVTYELHFYDEDGEFLTSTSPFSTSFTEDILPADGATYCRIQITPNDDDEITWNEIHYYASQLTITVDADQSAEETEEE